MELLNQGHGPCATVDDLAELGAWNILQYDPYEDESQNADKFSILDEELEVTPEWEDQYLNAEILLQRGDNMARGQMVCWKHDAHVNPVDRSNQNPVSYGSEITELGANIIVGLMYVQCDSDGSEYLLLDVVLNHKKNASTLSEEDEKVVING